MFDGELANSPAECAPGDNKGVCGAPRDKHGPGSPPAEDAAASDKAHSALCAFLTGFGLNPKANGGALIEQLLEGARALQRERPEASLAQCALEHAEQRFEAWLSLVLGSKTLDGRSPLMIGRGAFLLCQGPTDWSGLVLVDDDLPQPFVEAMRAAAPMPTPVAAPGTMAAQSLESWSITEAANLAAGALGEPFAWASGIRQLRSAPIRLIKFEP